VTRTVRWKSAKRWTRWSVATSSRCKVRTRPPRVGERSQNTEIARSEKESLRSARVAHCALLLIDVYLTASISTAASHLSSPSIHSQKRLLSSKARSKLLTGQGLRVRLHRLHLPACRHRYGTQQCLHGVSLHFSCTLKMRPTPFWMRRSSRWVWSSTFFYLTAIWNLRTTGGGSALFTAAVTKLEPLVLRMIPLPRRASGLLSSITTAGPAAVASMALTSPADTTVSEKPTTVIGGTPSPTCDSGASPSAAVVLHTASLSTPPADEVTVACAGNSGSYQNSAPTTPIPGSPKLQTAPPTLPLPAATSPKLGFTVIVPPAPPPIVPFASCVRPSEPPTAASSLSVVTSPGALVATSPTAVVSAPITRKTPVMVIKPPAVPTIDFTKRARSVSTSAPVSSALAMDGASTTLASGPAVEAVRLEPAAATESAPSLPTASREAASSATTAPATEVPVSLLSTPLDAPIPVCAYPPSIAPDLMHPFVTLAAPATPTLERTLAVPASELGSALEPALSEPAHTGPPASAFSGSVPASADVSAPEPEPTLEPASAIEPAPASAYLPAPEPSRAAAPAPALGVATPVLMPPSEPVAAPALISMPAPVPEQAFESTPKSSPTPVHAPELMPAPVPASAHIPVLAPAPTNVHALTPVLELVSASAPALAPICEPAPIPVRPEPASASGLACATPANELPTPVAAAASAPLPAPASSHIARPVYTCPAGQPRCLCSPGSPAHLPGECPHVSGAYAPRLVPSTDRPAISAVATVFLSEPPAIVPIPCAAPTPVNGPQMVAPPVMPVPSPPCCCPLGAPPHLPGQCPHVPHAAGLPLATSSATPGTATIPNTAAVSSIASAPATASAVASATVAELAAVPTIVLGTLRFPVYSLPPSPLPLPTLSPADTDTAPTPKKRARLALYEPEPIIPTTGHVPPASLISAVHLSQMHFPTYALPTAQAATTSVGASACLCPLGITAHLPGACPHILRISSPQLVEPPPQPPVLPVTKFLMEPPRIVPVPCTSPTPPVMPTMVLHTPPSIVGAPCLCPLGACPHLPSECPHVGHEQASSAKPVSESVAESLSVSQLAPAVGSAPTPSVAADHTAPATHTGPASEVRTPTSEIPASTCQLSVISPPALDVLSREQEPILAPAAAEQAEPKPAPPVHADLPASEQPPHSLPRSLSPQASVGATPADFSKSTLPVLDTPGPVVSTSELAPPASLISAVHMTQVYFPAYALPTSGTTVPTAADPSPAAVQTAAAKSPEPTDAVTSLPTACPVGLASPMDEALPPAPAATASAARPPTPVFKGIPPPPPVRHTALPQAPHTKVSPPISLPPPPPLPPPPTHPTETTSADSTAPGHVLAAPAEPATGGTVDTGLIASTQSPPATPVLSTPVTPSTPATPAVTPTTPAATPSAPVKKRRAPPQPPVGMGRHH